jgi:hypothetical protein
MCLICRLTSYKYYDLLKVTIWIIYKMKVDLPAFQQNQIKPDILNMEQAVQILPFLQAVVVKQEYQRNRDY